MKVIQISTLHIFSQYAAPTASSAQWNKERLNATLSSANRPIEIKLAQSQAREHLIEMKINQNHV